MRIIDGAADLNVIDIIVGGRAIAQWQKNSLLRVRVVPPWRGGWQRAGRRSSLKGRVVLGHASVFGPRPLGATQHKPTNDDADDQ